MSNTYIYRSKHDGIGFDAAFTHSEARTVQVLVHGLDNIAAPVGDAGCLGLEAIGVPITELVVDANGYATYVGAARHSSRYPQCYPNNMREKNLEPISKSVLISDNPQQAHVVSQ